VWHSDLVALGYVDAHRKTTGVVYSDEETTFTSLSGQPVIRWISYCKIGEYTERFPNIGFGMDRNARRPPSFMKKKARTAPSASFPEFQG